MKPSYSEWHKARKAKRHHRIMVAVNIIMITIATLLMYANQVQLNANRQLLDTILSQFN